MTLEEELARLLSFHTTSPQFSFYRDKLTQKVSLYLNSGKITKEFYNLVFNKIERKADEEGLYYVAYVLSLLDRYNPTVETHSFYDLGQYSVLKDLAETAENIQKMSAPLTGSDYLTESTIYKFLMSLLVKIQNTVDSPNRVVYFHLEEFELALVACLKDYSLTHNIRRLVYAYFDIKEIILTKDKEFYDEVYRDLLHEGYGRESNYVVTYNEDGSSNLSVQETLKSSVNRVINSGKSKVSESNVFNSSNVSEVTGAIESKVDEDKINSYYDLMIAICRYYRECFGSYSTREWPSKKIYKAILNMDCENSVKDYLTSLFSFYKEKINAQNLSYKAVFKNYLTYGNDFLFLSSKKEFILCSTVCDDLKNLVSLKSILSYCIGKADLSYMNRNDPNDRCATLASTLLNFSSAGLITNPDEIYEYVLKKLNWEVQASE